MTLTITFKHTVLGYSLAPSLEATFESHQDDDYGLAEGDLILVAGLHFPVRSKANVWDLPVESRDSVHPIAILEPDRHLTRERIPQAAGLYIRTRERELKAAGWLVTRLPPPKAGA